MGPPYYHVFKFKRSQYLLHVRDKNKFHRPPKDYEYMRTQKRDLLRKGNHELAGLGIFVWSIPALVARSDKCGRIKTCPNAGICAALC